MSKNENCNTCTIQTGKLILNQFHKTLRTTIITAPCFQQRLAILAGFLTTNTQCFCGSDIIQSIESVEANALNAVLLIVIDQIINNLNKAAVIGLFVILGIPFKSFFYLQIIKSWKPDSVPQEIRSPLDASPHASTTKFRHHVVFPNFRGERIRYGA